MCVAMADNSLNFYKQSCTLFIGSKPIQCNFIYQLGSIQQEKRTSTFLVLDRALYTHFKAVEINDTHSCHDTNFCIFTHKELPRVAGTLIFVYGMILFRHFSCLKCRNWTQNIADLMVRELLRHVWLWCNGYLCICVFVPWKLVLWFISSLFFLSLFFFLILAKYKKKIILKKTPNIHSVVL